MKRGSALILAIWIIAILSIIVLSFSIEARLQAGINIYVRERARVNHLIDAGKVIAEVLILDCKDVQDEQPNEDIDKILAEEDRWLLEKRNLKKQGGCATEYILVDEENPDSGFVKVEIATEQSDGININLLSKEGGDQNYQERWWMIFKLCGIPEELDTPEEGRIKLWNRLIASWDDWIDKDDTISSIDLEESGAEKAWYEEMYEKEKIDAEYRAYPRNGSIPSTTELAKIRGFRDFPAILQGQNQAIDPWEDVALQHPLKHGILEFIDVEGSAKINVNNIDIDRAYLLATIPGVFGDIEDDLAEEEAMELAKAIIMARYTEPQDNQYPDKKEWPFTDFADLEWRLNNNELFHSNGEPFTFERTVDRKADNYFEYGLTDNTQFIITITGVSGGLKRSVKARCYNNNGKVHYIDWQESPSS